MGTGRRRGLGYALAAVFAALLDVNAHAGLAVEYEGALNPGVSLDSLRTHFSTWVRARGGVVDSHLPEGRRGLRLLFHPAEGGIPLEIGGQGRLTGRAATSDLGPGYHQAVVGVLDEVRRGFAAGLAVRDDTGYWDRRDRNRLAQRMVEERLKLLDAALAKWPDDPMATLATPAGELDRRSVEAQRESLAAGEKPGVWFIWWSEMPDGPYWTWMGCTIYFGRFMQGSRPPDAERVLAAVEAYFARGKSQGCETWLSRFYQGLIQRDRGRLDAAIAWFQGALHLNPNQPQVTFALIGAQLDAGRPTEAERVAEALVSVCPASGQAWCRLGVARAMQGAYEGALTALDKATAVSPEMAEAWAERGVALREMKRLDDACESLHKSLALSPRRAVTHYNLGVTLARMERPSEAEAAMRQALALDPQHYDAAIELGLALLAQGKAEPAVQAFQQAARLNNRRWEAFYDMGRAYQALGRPDEAKQALREAERRGCPKEEIER